MTRHEQRGRVVRAGIRRGPHGIGPPDLRRELGVRDGRPCGDLSQHDPGLLDEGPRVLVDLDVVDPEQISREVSAHGRRDRAEVAARRRCHSGVPRRGTGCMSSSSAVVHPLAMTLSSRITIVKGPHAVATVAVVAGLVTRTGLTKTSKGA